jgi:hypothetical protein
VGDGLVVSRLFIRDLAGYRYLHEIVPRTEMPNVRSFTERSIAVSKASTYSDAEFH